MYRLALCGTFLVLVLGLMAPVAVSAQQPPPKKEDPGVVVLPNPFVDKQTKQDLTIQQIIGRAISVFLGIVGSVALVMFFYGGYLWLISGGSSDKIKKGKETLVWATIGLIVIFGSGILVRTVINALQAAG
mgnify:FL=1